MLFQQANLYHYFCQVKSQKDELYKKDIIMENVSFQQETNIEEVFNKYFSRIYRLALQTCKSPGSSRRSDEGSFYQVLGKQPDQAR